MTDRDLTGQRPCSASSRRSVGLEQGTTVFSGEEEGEKSMTSQPTRTRREQSQSPALEITLLELVAVLSEVTETEQETVAMALALITSGQVKLVGTFRDCSPERLN